MNIFAIQNLNVQEVVYLDECLAAFRSGGHAPAQNFEPVTAAGQNIAPQINGTTAQTDKFGVPYNPEFHAPGKGLTTAGRWMAKRGMDEATKGRAEAFEAQYRKAPASPVTNTPTPPAAPAAPQLPGRSTLPNFSPADPAPVPVSWDVWSATIGQKYEAGRYGSQQQAEIFAMTGLNDINQFETNAEARAITYPVLLAL